MSVPLALVALGVLIVVAAGGVGVVVHRGLAQIADQLSRPSGVQQELDRFWDDVRGALGHYATTKRVHDLEAQLTQLHHAHSQLVQTHEGTGKAVAWMYPLVRAWAGQGQQQQ